MKAVPPEMLMCLRHWRIVPVRIRQKVWRNYRPGQCDDKNPSAAWMRAADAAIGFVARSEGRAFTANEVEAMKELGFSW